MKTDKINLSQILAALASGAVVAAAFAAPMAQAEVIGSETAQQQSAAFAYDDDTAIPMPLPMTDIAPTADAEGAPVSLDVSGFEPGARGNGKQTPVFLGAPKVEANSGITPQEFGTSNHPFTTKRVDTAGTGTGNNMANGVSLRYPFRAAGKLYFQIGSSNYICSASLIKKGLIVTAAHCVVKFGGGSTGFYKNWQYVPARYQSVAPYGTWNVTKAYAVASYVNGTDSCMPGATGIVCANDVAVLVVTPQNGAYPGTRTGWFGFGWNGWGFTSTSPKLALFNQLGYPYALDGGLMMERTDSQAFVSSSMAGNSVWGGLQTGGSSGGPELVNLGVNPALNGTSFGTYSNPNMVVGVTSWGYTSTSIKQQGASPFTSGNIAALKSAACAAYPGAC